MACRLPGSWPDATARTNATGRRGGSRSVRRSLGATQIPPDAPAIPAPCPWTRHCRCGARSRPSPPRSPCPRRRGKRTRALNVTVPRGSGSATDLPRVALTSTFTCTNAEGWQGLQARLLIGRHERNTAMAQSSSAACLSSTRPWVLAASRPARVGSNSARVTTVRACSRTVLAQPSASRRAPSCRVSAECGRAGRQRRIRTAAMKARVSLIGARQ